MRVANTTKNVNALEKRLFFNDISCKTLGIKMQSKTFKYHEIREAVTEINEVKKNRIPKILQYI